MWWRAPTVVLICGAVILTLNMGIRQGFGLFLPPMTADLAWSTAAFSFATGLGVLVSGIAQPPAGMLADRFGAGRVLFYGGLLYAAGVALMAVSFEPWQFALTAGVMTGIAGAATGFPIVLSIVARVMPAEKRSLWLGIVSAGGSFGQMVIPVSAQLMIGGLGWATALILLGALAGVICFLVMPLAAAAPAPSGQARAGGQSLGAALKEASGHPGFWLMNAGFFVCGFHVSFIATHFPKYLVTCNLTTDLGAMTLAVIGGFNIVGTLLAGALGGRYRKKYLLSLLYGLRSLLIVVFLVLPISEWTVLGFGAIMGLLWLGTVPLTSGLVSQVFGPQYLASLFGIVLMSHQIGGFLGAFLSGWLFDLTGGYDGAWGIAIGLGVFAALIHLPIRDVAIARPAAQPA
ncbi:MAG: MFS transporter [Alphaproteobacteria bacterium]|nr:MFS transporter [Alphaproteobacteria bacterium]